VDRPNRTHGDRVDAESQEEAPSGGGGSLLVGQERLVDTPGELDRPAQEPEFEGLQAVDDSLCQSPAAGTPQERGPHGRVEAPEAGLEGNASAGELRAASKKVSLGLRDTVFDRAGGGGGGVHLDTQDRHVLHARDTEGSPLTIQDVKAVGKVGVRLL